MNRITITDRLFRESLAELLRSPDRATLLPAGLARSSTDIEILAPASANHADGPLLLQMNDDFAPPAMIRQIRAAVLLGRRKRRGAATGFLRTDAGAILPVDCLRLTGPGMSLIQLQGGQHPDLWEPDPTSLERWSRTIGALGMDTWLTFVRERFVVLGDGYLAQEMSQSLTRVGVRQVQHISPNESGQLRASHFPSGRQIHRLCSDADFLVVGGVEPETLLEAAGVASAYLKPLLLLEQQHGDSATAGTIVLMVPGGPCLFCGSSIEPAHRPGPANASPVSDFLVACAQRLLEDFLAAKVATDTVMRIDVGQAGLPEIRYNPAGVSRPTCPICTIRGSGDSGMSWLLRQPT